MRITLNIWQWASPPFFFGGLYLCLIRPWRIERRLSLDGMFFIVFSFMIWQDTVLNMINPQVTYNSRLLNWGSWDNYLPGWSFPNGERVVEPIFFTVPAYVICYGIAFTVSRVLAKCKSRWPSLTKLHLVLIAFSICMALDLLIEPLIILSGLWSYVGVWTPSWLTFFDGRWYQFPAVEVVLWGACLAIWASLRYFLDDKGRTVAERGTERLVGSSAKKTIVRQFAIIGVSHAILLFAYSLPMVIGSFYLRPWPEDVYKRSYFTNSLCGPGTEYACPNNVTGVPNRRTKVRFAPDGTLVIPKGVKLSNQLFQSGGLK